MKETKRVKVIIFLDNMKIEGYLKVAEGFLLTNYLNKSDSPFITLNNVVVSTLEGRNIMRNKFLCIHKNKILFATTEEE